MSASEETFEASVTCDLSPVGLNTVQCDANLGFGPMDNPQEVFVRLTMPQNRVADHLNEKRFEISDYFGDCQIEGRMVNTGQEFRATIAAIKALIPVGALEGLDVHCVLSEFQFVEPNSQDPAIVVFRVANVPHNFSGDIAVHRPAKDASVGPNATDWFKTTEFHQLTADERRECLRRAGWQVSFARIKFTFNNVNWSLDSATVGTPSIDKASQLSPLITARLTADASHDIGNETADWICDLLTLACGKDVRWVTRGWFQNDGTPSRVETRAVTILPYGKGQGVLVDHFEAGNVKLFLEESEAEFTRDPDWWRRSIGLHAHSRAATILEIRLSTLNTLIDRISTRVLKGKGQAEIDSRIPKRLKNPRFQRHLHRLLRGLSKENWEKNRTDAVSNTIDKWNSSPSFPNKVARVCDSLGISDAIRKKLNFRHKLIHLGEFDKKLKSDEEKITYLQSLEAVVELMMIRMLGFTGLIHIDEAGSESKKVEDFLVSEETS